MLAEQYLNTKYQHPAYPKGIPCLRYYVDDILVGGSIVGVADAQHLVDKFNISHVINVETEHTDEGVWPKFLCEARVPDNGEPFPKHAVTAAVAFSQLTKQMGGKLYVHCQMGASRSPAFAYAILRSRGFSAEASWKKVAMARGPDGGGEFWGNREHHVTYMKSVEDAL
jgi:protein-tyrosine phosphatase